MAAVTTAFVVTPAGTNGMAFASSAVVVTVTARVTVLVAVVRPLSVGTTVAGRLALVAADAPGDPGGVPVLTGILDPLVGEVLPPTGYSCVADELPGELVAAAAAISWRNSVTFFIPGVMPRPMAASGVASETTADVVGGPTPLPTPVVGVVGAGPLPEA